MKQILIILFSFFFLKTSAQETKFDGHKWQAPYFLDTLKGGGIERFLIPIEFAPSIAYKGVEDIRFTAGWGKKESSEYWSYAFLWYLDGLQPFDAKTFEKNLAAYYTGLATTNIDKSKLDSAKAKAKASIKQVPGKGFDSQTFEGTVDLLDFLSLQPIRLHFIIHVKRSEALNKTFVFHEASPQPYTHDVWKTLNSLWSSFKLPKDQ
jgi:hypothetical protein